MAKIIGINPVYEAIKSGKEIEKLEIFKGIRKENIKEILRLATVRNIKVIYKDKREDNNQGVSAIVSDYDDNYITLDELLEKELVKKYSTIVILDQVQDPRNFGAIIRSSECFGVKGIIIQDRNNAKLSETVYKTAAGALEYVDIVKVTNISDTIDKLKKYGYFVYGSSSHLTTTLYDEVSYPEKVALVVGNEGNGMRKKVSEHCDMNVKINLHGEINSLNVSVATGILLAEISKNRK
ncbi:23S rRNA (guanosine(2251)-2'-O)-methyltransferase RlmB [Oceanivirga miroungae]|uniref:TrmH family RNA methyltransferase n=1 Tax=Oceanivirga miroungae TaxID=1130046 RepID=A0A6I8M5V9_9FUSO|nr:23S rRNA (guanosine(2251)-2'-O)-methyltransferase RlmB [Oceanivirga miroungae]VWL84782.1 TrmH family RNA methyltransferase [Oceanivirga miroungae]